eukprot:TRINITY_DN9409_c0_g1_i2.p1 TRINITY_DN9409_c0_g1~~TRINITY_DN9409_c0_g1_i2.p1  ORF type:complete len:215 (-),score=43.34 TRINITY_DN9409_c0_g1_i2:81-725(-)
MTSVRSARDNAYDALQEFTKLSKALLSSVVDVGEEREGTNPEEVMKQLIEADKRLQAAVQILCQEQVFHRKIEQLNKAIEEKERETLVFTTHLKNADAKLNALLDSSYANIQSLNVAQSRPVSVTDLVNYSHQVSRRMCDFPYPGVGLQQNVAPYPDIGLIEATRIFNGISKVEKPDYVDSAIAQFLTVETPAPKPPSVAVEPDSSLFDPDFDF